VKEQLIFIARAELAHLVATTYPDLIQPFLRSKAAAQLEVEPRLVSRIVTTPEYRAVQRRCLFLGLSDGARIDAFRRISAPAVSHEQVIGDYQLAFSKAQGALRELGRDLKRLQQPEARFSTVVLLDDFSASGISYLREEDGKLAGKLARVADDLSDPDSVLSGLVERDELDVVVILYIATDQAVAHLKPQLTKIADATGVRWHLHRVHALPDSVRIRPDDGNLIHPLVERYYDPRHETRHMKKGGQTAHYGFGGCGLGVVLTHNTPNNSLVLLWGESPDLPALFPRVSRHQGEETLT
jgi:hypothetical protein